jgi:hypothetical protein
MKMKLGRRTREPFGQIERIRFDGEEDFQLEWRQPPDLRSSKNYQQHLFRQTAGSKN